MRGGLGEVSRMGPNQRRSTKPFSTGCLETITKRGDAVTRKGPGDLGLLLIVLVSPPLRAQTRAAPSADSRTIAPGVWFFAGDSHRGYCNSIVIEMKTYLILVDPSYPGRTEELVKLIASVSPKPVRYVFDTHAHGDHSYANAA